MRQWKSTVFFFLWGMFLLCVGSLKADWSTPVNIDASTTNQTRTDVRVVMDSSGNSIAVWSLFNNSNSTSKTQASVRPAGGSWSTPVDLTAATAITSTAPSIAMDASGNAVVVWQVFNDIPPTYYLQSATYINGAWSSTVTFAIGNNPKVAVDPSGNAIAVWRQSSGNPSNNRLQAAALAFGSNSWVNSASVSTVSQVTGTPSIAIDSSGNAVVVWNSSADSINVVKSATLPNGGNWTTETIISDTSLNSGDAAVAISPDGNAVAVWNSFDGTYYTVQSSSLPYGGSWSSLSTLSTAVTAKPIPQIAMDPFGSATAIWNQSIGTLGMYFHYVTQVATLANEGTWSTPQSISDLNEISIKPAIVIDSKGNIVAAWQSTDNGTTYKIDVAWLAYQQSWSSPLSLTSISDGAADVPAVGVSSTGDAVVVWPFLGGASRYLQASNALSPYLFPAPQAPSSFSGRLIKCKFPMQLERVHRLKWSASSDSSTAGYHIYENGQLIRTISASGPFNVDLRHRTKRGYTYKLAAFNPAGEESTELTVQMH